MRVVLFMALLSGCAGRAGKGADLGTEREGFRLVWQDEFEGDADTPPDSEYWNHDVGGEGWGNNQLEYNTDELKNAYHTGEGTLTIVAYAEPYGDNYYTSAHSYVR